MLIVSESSRDFLEKYLPEAFKCGGYNELDDVLILLDGFINQYGFAPPDYEDYNELGDEAQRVYNDLFDSNTTEEERAPYMFPLPDNPNIDEEDRRKAARELSKYFDD